LPVQTPNMSSSSLSGHDEPPLSDDERASREERYERMLARQRAARARGWAVAPTPWEYCQAGLRRTRGDSHTGLGFRGVLPRARNQLGARRPSCRRRTRATARGPDSDSAGEHPAVSGHRQAVAT
jgi:hypothetical protein